MGFELYECLTLQDRPHSSIGWLVIRKLMNKEIKESSAHVKLDYREKCKDIIKLIGVKELQM